LVSYKDDIDKRDVADIPGGAMRLEHSGCVVSIAVAVIMLYGLIACLVQAWPE